MINFNDHAPAPVHVFKGAGETKIHHLKGRVVALTVPGGPERATFRDPNTAKMIRQQVQSILGLP